MRRSSPDYEEHFSVEDCDALLKFPYHEYNVKIKKEEQEFADGESCHPGPSNSNSVTNFGLQELSTVEESESVPFSDSMSVQLVLTKNQLCQRKMVHCLNKIQKSLKACYEKKELEQAVAKEDEKLKHYKEEPSSIKPISLFAAPYFRDIRGMVPFDNEDTIKKKKNHEVNAYLAPPKPWTRTENKRLLNGVATSALCQVMKPWKLKRDFLKNKLKDKDLLEFEIDVLKKEISGVEKTITYLSKKPFMECLEESRDKIDWMTISATNMQGTRSAEECENMWKNYLDFSVNKGQFTEEEDMQLKQLAEEHNERDWDTIAELLQTNRTAIQCFERYQTKISSTITRKFWTKEEDKHLVNIVEGVRIGDFIPWNKVCCYMEGRTRAQIMNRYERSVSKQISRAPWTKKEDAMLIACVKKIGYVWSKMGRYFPGRSAYACRERYMNTLNPSIKIGGWSKDEDILLINFIKEYGYGKWAKISQHLPGRTDNMCLMRAQRLKLHSTRKSRKTLKQDEDVDDPEIVSKILKPIAPTKNCEVQNFRLKTIRCSALDSLLIALKNIQPNVKYEADIEKLDLSSAGPNILHQIYVELNKLKSDPENVTWEPRYREKSRERKKVKIVNENDIPYADWSDGSISSENEDEKLPFEEPKEKLNKKEKMKLDKIFDSIFEVSGCMLYPHLNKKFVALNARAAAEQSLYKYFLYQTFNCKSKFDENEDIGNVAFGGIDYSVSLADIVYHFVQPTVYENQFIVLAPNLATIDGMDTVNATEKKLQSMSKFVNHFKSSLDYNIGDSEEVPKCFHCQQEREESYTFIENMDPIRKSLEEENFIVDELMEKAIFSEYANPINISASCVCKKISKVKESLNILKKRLFSLALWPELLSSTGFSEQQSLIVCAHKSTNLHVTNGPSKIKKKRGRPKSFKVDNAICRKRGRPKGSKSKSSINQGQQLSGSNLTPSKRAPDDSPDVSLLRRSKRSCVLNRRSYVIQEFK